MTNPSDPGTVSLGAGQVLTLPVSSGVFSIRLGEGSDTNEQIPPTVFFDATSNAVRSSVKLAVWFSADGGAFTRLTPDVEFASVPFAMVAGIAETVKERAVTTAMLTDGSIETSKLTLGGVTGDRIANETISVENFTIALRQASIIPPGTIIPFAGPVGNVPAGWKFCDGSAVSRVTYAALFAAIGTTWGTGDGSVTFTIPDLRGTFLRGTGTSGSKIGPTVGTTQDDQFQDHYHRIYSTNPNRRRGISGTSALTVPIPGDSAGLQEPDGGPVISGKHGSETRPVNSGIAYIIKF
ncbi:MAG: tail fiber protein [Verrucomicrobia bacterium]|nr:tail fiber protein [Verrucomicrobiota bacterium]